MSLPHSTYTTSSNQVVVFTAGVLGKRSRSVLLLDFIKTCISTTSSGEDDDDDGEDDGKDDKVFFLIPTTSSAKKATDLLDAV